MELHKTLNEMEKYGGGFVKALAKAWKRADRINHLKLKEAFGDIFSKYEEFAEKDSDQ